ncbi:MAG: FAD-dependent oxidoreductase, partial [Deltaproteobacteria bacterium]|nr:FAD-dependent oxidoreductase [Deltaproteobacteria bacterium]
MKIQKVDVLVIGGGGAGMQAALAAKDRGADVLLVSKTPVGKSTCTSLSGGMFAVATEGMSKEAHLENTLQAGKGLNARELAQLLVAEAPGSLQELTRLGLDGQWQSDGFYCLGNPPAWGAPFAELLANTIHGRGISVLPWVIVGELVVQEGRVLGAVGFDFRTGKAVAIQAKAVILANGGGGALYQRNDNPVRITGDGYALAFHAGCHLRDMECVQFLPSGLAEPGKPALLIAPTLCDYGKVVNSAGEDILGKYQITEKPVAVRCRDSFSQAIFQEESEGRDVFLDLRSLSEADWPKNHLAVSQRGLLVKNLFCGQKPLRISPMCHHFMGGVVIDPDGHTEVPGLFAAGEVAGGVHGANRMGGNALAEVLVFGYRAGISAARWARQQGSSPEAENRLAAGFSDFQKKIQGSKNVLPPRALRKKISGILWNQGGIM